MEVRQEKLWIIAFSFFFHKKWQKERPVWTLGVCSAWWDFVETLQLEVYLGAFHTRDKRRGIFLLVTSHLRYPSDRSFCLHISIAYHSAWNVLGIQKVCDKRKQNKLYPRQSVALKCCCISTIQFFQKARLCCVKQNVPGKSATISNPSYENFWVNML